MRTLILAAFCAFSFTYLHAQTWVNATNGVVPASSFVAGQDSGGQFFYICRGTYLGQTNAGRTLPGSGCLIENSYRTVTLSTYQVLTDFTGAWLRATNGTIPAEAYNLSAVGPATQYSCRAQIEGGIYPGRIQPGMPGCFISFISQSVYSTDYEILWNPWVSASNGNVPSNAASFGTDVQNGFLVPIYLCRAPFQGVVQLGKVRSALGGCKIAVGSTYGTITVYEVLTNFASNFFSYSNGNVPPTSLQAYVAAGTPAQPKFACRVSVSGASAYGGVAPQQGCQYEYGNAANLAASYDVLMNSNPFTLTNCFFSLSSTSGQVPAAGGSSSFTVSTGSSACGWAVYAPNTPWITITSQANLNTGGHTVTFTAAPNPSSISRAGTIAVGGKFFNVNQAGVPCTYSLSPVAVNGPATAGSGSVGVAAPSDCQWIASSSASWLSITSGGAGGGSGIVAYTVSPNTNNLARSATITVHGQVFTFNQLGAPCTYSLNPSSTTLPASGGNLSIGLTTIGTCPWTAQAATLFATLTSPASGTGSTTVTYSVSANPSTTQRATTLTIGGQSFVLTQSGTAPCSYLLSASSSTIPAAGGTGSVSVTTQSNCSWSAAATDSWLSITGAASGTGNGSVSFTAQANPTAFLRNAALVIGGQTYVLNQLAVSCPFSLSLPGLTLPSDGGSGSFDVATSSVCPWTAVSSDPWLYVTSSSSGLGSSSISFSALPNQSPSPRSATLTVGGQTYTVAETGIATGLQFVPVTPCRIADTRSGAAPFGAPSISGNTARSFPIPSSACSIPPAAQAYSMNVTVVPQGPLSYLTIWPTGQTQPFVSTLNSGDGRIKANAALVPAGTAGAVSVFVTNTADVILDINGYFVPADSSPGSLAFYPITPCRVSDTRNPVGLLGGPALVAGQSRTIPVASTCGVPISAQAYSLNFTVVPGGPLAFLSTWPTGSSQPLVSTLNAPTGAVTANAALVPAGASGSIDVYGFNATDLIIDINGYFAPPTTGGLSLYPVTPCRVSDTRNPVGPFGGTSLLAGSTRSWPVVSSPCLVPLGAQAFALNATVVPAPSLSYLTLWPTGGAQPFVSTLNAGDGAVVANAAIVPASSTGSLSAFVPNATDLILDISGYFAP